VRPRCDRCVSRGTRAPCQYEKLHHVRSLREEISELQAELVEAKGNAPPNTSALKTSPRLLELEKTGLYERPWISTLSTVLRTDRSAVGSSATDSPGGACGLYGDDTRESVPTRPGIVPGHWEYSHKTQPSTSCSRTHEDVVTRMSRTPGFHKGEGLVQIGTSSMDCTDTDCGTYGHFHGQSMHSTF
jgi:hypothetical protein